MRITKSVTFEICDEIGVFHEVERDSYEYAGPIAECKKGRDLMQQNAKFQQGQAQNLANQGNAYNTTLGNLLNEEVAGTTPGSMSPAAAAMFSSDMANINNTYNGMRANMFANEGTRGFGNAPSGFTVAALNGLNQGQANAQQSAYNQGQLNTEQQRQNAMNTASGARNASISGEVGNTQASSNSAFDLNRMGSGLGDVLSGVSSILPGISGISSFVNQWRNSGNLMNQPWNRQTQNLPQSPSAIGNY